jgi:hypothetical protein
MGHPILTTASIAAALLLAPAATPIQAQSQLPRPGQLPPAGGQMAPQQQQQQQQQPPQQQAAPRPYQPVSISPPPPLNDPSFEAFRKQLGAIADKKDRRALAGLVAQNFFWFGEKGDKADKKRPGIDNLAKAMSLDAKDGGGWDALYGLANDPTAAPFQERKGAICSPAEPNFNEQEFEALLKATDTQDGDWAYPFQPGLEMRAAAQPNAPVVEKLGMHFVRVMDDDNPANQGSPMLRVVAPSGKTGFVPSDALSPLGSDQICYIKEGGGWKIVGFIGGE